MMTPEALAELVGFEVTGQRVLSVVLGLDPERQIERDYLVVFRNLVREQAGNLDDEGRKELEIEAERVETFLTQTPPEGLGVLIYSCTPAGFWRVYYLPEAPADAVYFTPKPRLRPALDLLDENERYAVVLADRDSARILIVSQRDIEDWWQLQSVVPGRHKQGGWSQANFQRSHDKAVDDHLKSVRDHLTQMDSEMAFNRIAIGGPTETTARFMNLLPAALREQVIDTFAIEMFATDAEVMERTRTMAAEAEREGESVIVEQAINDAAAGGPAASGLDATLLAVSNAQVGLLVVEGNLVATGGTCPSCGRLAAGDGARCPACGAELSAVDDIVEYAIGRVIMAGGGVELVHGAAATRLQAEAGGIGALLRYVPSEPVAAS